MPSATIDEGGQKFVDLVYSVVKVPSTKKIRSKNPEFPSRMPAMKCTDPRGISMKG